MAELAKHGGKRRGAGRPKGSVTRRSEVLAEALLSNGQCPVDALVRLAQEAEAQGDLGQAIGAWKSILPYVYPKPKAVEIEPEIVIELAKEIAKVRASAATKELGGSYGELLDRFFQQNRAKQVE